MDSNLLREQLEKNLVSSPVLLSGAKLLDNNSWSSPQITDPNYLPFYYHLGKQLTPGSVLQIGAKLGLVAACFLRSCKTADLWIVMDEGQRNSIISSNIHLHMPLGQATYVPFKDDLECAEDDKFECDLALLTEDYGEERCGKYLEVLWKYLKPEGLLVADYINSHDAFHEFCRVANREPEIFKTRYGVGIIQR